jgi:ABC-2 type transport system ATP-binding protein
VLEGLSVRVQGGAVCAVLGPNGAGKTTLFRIVLGLLEPASGTVAVLGRPAGDRQVRGSIGYVAAELPSSLLLTLEEYLALHEALQPAFDPRLAASLLQPFGLGHARRQLLADLSHGQRKKVQLVAALGHRPRLVVLDEPFSGLDPSSHHLLSATLAVLAELDTTVLLASHDTHSVGQVADTVLVLDAGRAVATGPPDEVCAALGAADLREAYLVATGAAGDLRARAAAVADLLAAS